MLHLLGENTGIVSMEESVGTFLYVVEHNTDFKQNANHFQHSLDTIQRRFRYALRAIHSLGCPIIQLGDNAAELLHHFRKNNKYYSWFKV